MTVLLVTTESVKKRMVMAPELLGVDPALESAIIAAQLRIESELDTSLSHRENEDTFYINPELFGGVVPAGNVWRLYLKNGQIDESVPVVISVSRKRLGPYTEIDPALIDVDADRGIAYVDNGLTNHKFVKIKYTSGYTTATAPDWLKEAILGYVPVCLSLGPAADPKKKASYDESLNHAQILLHRHLRNVGTVFRAIT